MVKLELTVMDHETVFQILFQLFVMQIIIVIEMATVYLKQYLYQVSAYMDIKLNDNGNYVQEDSSLTLCASEIETDN